jgi:replicative DNA helicase
MDANVTALRQLARDLCTCIVVVSTLNRSSYDGGISLDSYKESGAIEYGADVLMGLQPRGVDDVANDARKKQEQRAAEILSLQAEYRTAKEKHAEVVVLKNRNGGTPKRPAALDFDAMVNTFKDARTVKAAPSRI